MTLALDGSVLRGWRGARWVEASRDELARYAAVCGDRRPERLAGEVASPVWTCVPFGTVAREFFAEFLGDQVTGRLVHLASTIEVDAPVPPATPIEVTAGVVGLRHTPQGAVVDLAGIALGPGGTRLASQSGAFLVAGCATENPFPAPAPAPASSGRAGASEQVVSVVVARDQAVRYAEVSGDRNPIHLDAAAARRIGFPAPILHGMCTLALTCAALERALGREARSLRTEFARPVFNGDALSVRWRPTADGAAFEVLNRRRRPVLRAGNVVAPAPATTSH